MRIAVPTAEPMAATSSASATMQDCGFFASVEQLGKSAPQTQRRDLGRELDDQDGIGKAAERCGAVRAGADEYEGDARHQP